MMRSDMPIFQMKRVNRLVSVAAILLALFMIAGCVAKKSDSVQPEPDAKKSTQTAVPQTAAKMTESGPERKITDIDVETKGEVIEIRIQGNQRLVYTSIKQSFPFGIAVYLPETMIADGFRSPAIDYRGIGGMKVSYADAEKTTAKIEILLKEDLDYEMVENGSNLTLQLLGLSEQEPVMAVQKSPEPAVRPVAAAPQKTITARADAPAPAVVPGKTVRMTDIEFNAMEDGTSDIIIQTTHPVKYDIIQGGEKKLYLNLYNTEIPDYHKRPILTYYFKSAVESLMPIQVPGKEKNAKIEINIRDQVPYRVVQEKNTLSLFFEASTITPPKFTKAKKKVVSGRQVAEIQRTEAESPQVTAPQPAAPAPPVKKKSIEEEIFGVPKVYTGEKIKLDFFETDIKNVFRILRSVGGLNFAIDKNVSGKVTLTLEEPVPWDQVLDLVLKMNNLGQKKEGNVIRIATLATLQKEEKARQDIIASRKKALAQKKSLEPLVTEYIPINYSDAEKDIRPHLTQILTPKRGTISVDKRTNMIILTDVQAKVDQAKEIIYRLDRVTPQIMIEAKVVEVTKNFSRELGMGLSLSERTTGVTGVQDFTTAFNSPIAAPVTTGSFNFFRLFGSSTTQLNAQIAASETKGDVKVISSPRILTLDNKKAKIKQGLEYAYLERDDTGGSSVKFKSIDLLLEVTPHVTPDRRIALNVYLTKNDIDSITDGVPSLSTNEAQTELLVNDSDTIVIGGIVKTTDNRSSSGTPILSGIPILGRLFRTDRNTDNRTELLIFITPSIVQLEQKRNAFANPGGS